MKKYFFLLVLLVLSINASAQLEYTGEGNNRIGLNLGFSANPLRERANVLDTTLSQVTRPYSFKVGMVYEATIIKGFGLQMGLNYTFGASSGKWIKDANSTVKKTKTDILYHQIELPIDWQYKFEIAKETYLIAYTGPTLQLGLAFHKRKSVKDIDPATFKEVITTSYSNLYSKTTDIDQDGVYDYNRFNITWGLGVGLQYQRYYLRGGYDFGIYSPYHDLHYTSANTNNEFNRKGRQDQWYLKIGIFLWND